MFILKHYTTKQKGESKEEISGLAVLVNIEPKHPFSSHVPKHTFSHSFFFKLSVLEFEGLFDFFKMLKIFFLNIFKSGPPKIIKDTVRVTT